jgi:four helix bundle protein
MMDLKIRTRTYALRIIRLYDAMPGRGVGRVLREQVVRSGTSVGAHYREAIRGRSTAEYAAKMNGGLMELEETLYWLELIEESGIMPAKKLAALRTETGELTAILVSLIKARKR